MATLRLGIDASDARRGAQQFEQSASSATRSADDLRRRVGRVEGSFDRLKRESFETARGMDRLERGFVAAGRAARGFVAIAIAETLRRGASAALSLGDEATRLENRLRLVTDTSRELEQRQQALLDLSERTRSGLAETTNLYVRLDQALAGTGQSTERILSVTESFNTALSISGATQQEAAAATTQFSQAIAGSVVRAEEFNSLIDASPRLIRALINQLEGVDDVGALRGLLEDGELVRERVLNALIRELPTLRQELEQTEATGGDAMQQLGNEVLTLAGNIDDATGATRLWRDALLGVRDVLGSINESFEREGPREALQGRLDELIERRDRITARMRESGQPASDFPAQLEGLRFLNDQIATLSRVQEQLSEPLLGVAVRTSDAAKAMSQLQRETEDTTDAQGRAARLYERNTGLIDAHAGVLADAREEQERFNRSLTDLMDEINPAGADIRNYREDADLLREALARGAIDAEQFNRALGLLNQRFAEDASIEDTTSQLDDVTDAADRAARGMGGFEQAAVGAFREAGRSIQRELADSLLGGFEDVGSAMVNIARRTAAEIAAAFVTQRFVLPVVGAPIASLGTAASVGTSAAQLGGLDFGLGNIASGVNAVGTEEGF
ncbi:tape measure protein [Ferruginivarius sediminum]|uniref:Tape measure protein N-terminal domain-containing protein n=1 Tax=Ferruginivarius sediminum TaxID=2661937 RepID=A0A369TE28_9PROT|nr:tape measure protein [Ferruginivarius sediminum]RDD62625.1 hypothetical protein DRB17_05545 [Ferruginivarius sediminum]